MSKIEVPTDIYVCFSDCGGMEVFKTIEEAKSYVVSGTRWVGPVKYRVCIAPYAVIKVGE